ncbi:tryptophan 2,3-dioxygenase family protein [Actinomadura madurae]|uniref:tryptophan 2,3-dioxygenase family protein n=1 Tax=Actinomadura madurae TaxID=1993 RepID=UPI0020D24E03|nr:tryptophan 2,3-dioxygenase family protein [Actinomadura madurae]MCQ0011367.1 tryptophan 2,3-dioxygenase [Actinomadura madurae]
MCEALVDVDEGIQEWRYRHLKMVERTIGAKIGTGGSARRRLPAPHPVRPRLPRPVGGPLADRGGPRPWRVTGSRSSARASRAACSRCSSAAAASR